VTLDGAPLDQAVIVFVPCAPTGAKQTGAEIKAGRYTIDAANGVLPGRYRIEVQSYVSPIDSVRGTFREPSDADRGQVRPRIPAHYNARTILQVQTTEGANQFDFSLTTSPPQGVAKSM
jgi:hypothetical protein